MAAYPDHIQNFALFGDDGDLPDVVHVETIEARSKLHDWEFAPHRHGGLHQILLVQSGGGHASLDGQDCRLSDMKIANVPVGIVHGYRFSPGTTGRVLTLAAETLDASLHPTEGLRQVLARPALIDARPEMVNAMEKIETAFASRRFGRAHILRALTALLLGQIAQAMAGEDLSLSDPADPPLLSRFEALIDAHFTDHWSVAVYARALAVSPTHLSRVARTATGRPASRLIEERLIREARRNLVYTNLPISTIAYMLGFDDPAYFSRVFSRVTGTSPRAFRQRRHS